VWKPELTGAIFLIYSSGFSAPCRLSLGLPALTLSLGQVLGKTAHLAGKYGLWCRILRQQEHAVFVVKILLKKKDLWAKRLYEKHNS
jgi:hypothetical protein